MSGLSSPRTSAVTSPLFSVLIAVRAGEIAVAPVATPRSAATPCTRARLFMPTARAVLFDSRPRCCPLPAHSPGPWVLARGVHVPAAAAGAAAVRANE